METIHDLYPVLIPPNPAYPDRDFERRLDYDESVRRQYQHTGGVAALMRARREGKPEPSAEDSPDRCFCPVGGDRSLRYLGDETYSCDGCGVHIVRGVATLARVETAEQLSLFTEVQDATP